MVGYPHDLKGQGIYAYVTLNSGIEPTEELRKELVTWVRKEIGPIASPDLIQWAPGLPKTRSGKIMRRILRKIAANEHDALGDTSTLADPGVVNELVDNRMNRGLISAGLKLEKGSRKAPPCMGLLMSSVFQSRFSDIAYPSVRSKGPSLRPDHERGRTRGWVEVKDGPQGHRRRRRPASLRSAHPRVTLGWLGRLMTGQFGGSAVPRRSSRVRGPPLDPTTLYSVRHAAGDHDASCASEARLPGGWDHSFSRLAAHRGASVHHPPRKAGPPGLPVSRASKSPACRWRRIGQISPP